MHFKATRGVGSRIESHFFLIESDRKSLLSAIIKPRSESQIVFSVIFNFEIVESYSQTSDSEQDDPPLSSIPKTLIIPRGKKMIAPSMTAPGGPFNEGIERGREGTIE